MGNLSQAPAVILQQYLVANNIFVDPGQEGFPLYITHMPDADDIKSDSGAIYDTAGVLDGRHMKGDVIEHYGIQIKLRTNDYQIGYAKGTEITKFMEFVINQSLVINGKTFTILNVSRTTPVIPIGVEPGTQRRDLFTINFLATIREE